MELIGQIVVYIMMGFLAIGGIAYMINSEKGMGKEFKEGIFSVGPIFLAIAGIMAIVPILGEWIPRIIGPLYALMHADVSMAPAMLLPGDMGAYFLGHDLAGSHGAWMMAFSTSFTMGVLAAFVIPVGLSMLKKSDHPYLALGVMAGVMSTPIAVFVITILLQATGVPLRSDVSTDSPSDTPFALPIGSILLNLLPMVIFAAILALALRFAAGITTKIFIIFGRVLQIVATTFLVIVAIEYFTGFALPFNPPLDLPFADEENVVRALEVSGIVAVMLGGAFPMVYAFRTWLSKPLSAVGGKLGFSPEGAVGIIAAMANALALFHIIKQMPVRDKVVTIAFAVSGGFVLADHLAFTANFQPNMVGVLILGKLFGGVVGILFALWLAVPYALRVEAAQKKAAAAEADPETPEDDELVSDKVVL